MIAPGQLIRKAHHLFSAASIPILTRPSLSPSVLLSCLTPGRLPEPLDAAGVTFHPKARNALWHGINALQPRPGQTVLMPSYHCGAELDAVIKAGAQVRFYRVDRRARVELDHLRRMIDENTRCVLITHYFGFPEQDLPILVSLCQEHQLFLIEDCAHALYSSHEGRWLGTWGDMAIFSPWKTLPLPDGGALLSNNPTPELKPMTISPQVQGTLEASRRRLEAHFLTRHHAPYVLARRLVIDPLAAITARGAVRSHTVSTHPISAGQSSAIRGTTFDPQTQEWRMSSIADFIIRHTDHRQVLERRRNSFQFLLAELEGVRRVRLIYPALPEGVCPLWFPLVVDDPHSLQHHLSRHRIGSELFWQEFHERSPKDEFPDSTYLKTHTIALPIHQDLDAPLLKRMAQSVQQWSLGKEGR